MVSCIRNQGPYVRTQQKIFENWHGSPSKTAICQLREEKPVTFILRYYTKLPCSSIEQSRNCTLAFHYTPIFGQNFVIFCPCSSCKHYFTFYQVIGKEIININMVLNIYMKVKGNSIYSHLWSAKKEYLRYKGKR